MSFSYGCDSNKGDPTKSEDLHVVTENGEQCFMWRANQLTYIAQDRQELPLILATKFGPVATKLDLSYNSLTSFKNINLFSNLNELILDNNNLRDEQLNFRMNLRLKTLSLNKNKLVDLFKVINSIKVHYPNLEYLSLIGNPLCPGPRLVSGSNLSSHELSASSQTKAEKINKIMGDTTTAILNGGIHGIDELILSNSHEGNTNERSTACLRKDLNLIDLSQQKYRYFIIYHLPNLRFLDSSPISSYERDEALRRCFWMKRMYINEIDRVEMAAQDTDSNCQRDNSADSDEFRLTIMSNQQEQSKGVFSRLTYKYTGKNSEGNRFIRNSDL